MDSAKLHKIGKINVLELHGSYRGMGREYGKALKAGLNKFCKMIINTFFVKADKASREMAARMGAKIFDSYPERFKEILYGMSEGSGIAVEKLVMLDQFIIVALVMRYEKMGCSSIGVWGDYTKGGPLVFGRNFDFPEFCKVFNEFLTVAVFNPDDASVPMANIGYAGQIITNTGMNKAGIFLSNNEGLISGGNLFYTDRAHTLIMETAFLLDSSFMDEIDTAIKATPSSCTLIVNVADKNVAYAYEWPTFGVKRRQAEDEGLLVTTNHFMDPSWGVPEIFPETPEFTLKRRKNLLALGKKYKGKFSPEIMRRVLDIPFDEGGATHLDITTYQVVAIPEELKFFLKIPGFQDWTEINLDSFFR